MVDDIRKYPRTQHIQGSRLQHGDHDLEAVPWEGLRGKHLVVEEKVDGANVGVSFDRLGGLRLQSRGHYLRGGPREKQFELLKQWAACKRTELWDALGSRYVMYGEWLFAKHTCFYDALPHYFMEFDVLDTETSSFLDTARRRELLASCNIVPVRVLGYGVYSECGVEVLQSFITWSAFITDGRKHNFLNACVEAGVLRDGFANKEISEAMATGDWDERMEGLYLKWEEDGVVKGRYKLVRETFTNSILDQEQHWHDRPIVQNRLIPGAFGKMFT